MNLRKTNKYVNFEMLYLPAGYHVQITTGPIISGFLWSEWRLVEHMCDIPTFCPMANIYDLSKNRDVQRLITAYFHPSQCEAPIKSLELDYN